MEWMMKEVNALILAITRGIWEDGRTTLAACCRIITESIYIEAPPSRTTYRGDLIEKAVKEHLRSEAGTLYCRLKAWLALLTSKEKYSLLSKFCSALDRLGDHRQHDVGAGA